MNINTSINKNVSKYNIRKKVGGSSSPQTSFKGVPAIISNAERRILGEFAKPTIIANADREIMNVFSRHYGDIAERVGYKIGKLSKENPIMKKGSRFVLEKGVSSIKDKSYPRGFIESVLFPFVSLPLYGANWCLKKAQSLPNKKDSVRNIYNKPFFRVPRKLNELDEKTNIIQGIYGQTKETVEKCAKEYGLTSEELLNKLKKADNKKLAKEANEYIKENLYKSSNKFFDKTKGKFNTAHERPLNRIVTGLIPVAFLANDAYNLSVLCGDKKEDSEKEAKIRIKQEVVRVFTNASIQVLVYGTLTKIVNKSAYAMAVIGAVITLVSEFVSRMTNNRPVMLLSKEGAKKYNQTHNPENVKNNELPEKKSQVKVNSISSVKFEQPNIFKSFNPSFASSKNEKDKKSENKKEQKALINFETLKKGVLILLGASTLISFLKNSSLTKNSKPMKFIKSIGDFFKTKIYNKLAYKEFEMPNKDYQDVMGVLKEVGCEKVAEGHEFIQNKYGKICNNGKDVVIKMYKSKLSGKDVKNVTESIAQNLKSGNKYNENEIAKITEAINFAIKNCTSEISENKFETVAKNAIKIATNKDVELTEEQINSLNKLITKTIKNNVSKEGIKMKSGAKTTVDAIIQPFKFILGVANKPFSILESIVRSATSNIDKKFLAEKAGEKDVTISKFEKTIHTVVSNVFGEQSPKTEKISQEIFTNAIEVLQKETKPYRKAKNKLAKLIISNASGAEIDKAKLKLENEKAKLAKYVDTAVGKSFNSITQSNTKNNSVALMSKVFSSLVTSFFLVADNYNMVMIKSNGEDKEKAKESANERIVQRLSALFYQTIIISWFNQTFAERYNKSLGGMVTVTAPNTALTEVITRTSIGMPVRRKTYDELMAIEEKNENRTGFLGKYFKFMRLLTGKKPLSQRLPKNKTTENSSSVKTVIPANKTLATQNTKSSTNLLEKYLK